MGRDRLGPITPLPINARELRGLHAVLLFGGSFDPPHTAHVAAGEMARDRLYGDRGWLLFVPAARSPSKRVDSARAPTASADAAPGNRVCDPTQWCHALFSLGR